MTAGATGQPGARGPCGAGPCAHEYCAGWNACHAGHEALGRVAAKPGEAPLGDTEARKHASCEEWCGELVPNYCHVDAWPHRGPVHFIPDAGIPDAAWCIANELQQDLVARNAKVADLEAKLADAHRNNSALLSTLEHSATHKALEAMAAENGRLRERNARLVALLTGGTYECSFKSWYSSEDGDRCPGERLGRGPCWNHRRLAEVGEA